MAMALSERFPQMTPITIRETRASEIFLLLRRLDTYDEKQPESYEDGEVIRRPADDSWF